MKKYYQPTRIYYGQNEIENLATIVKRYGKKTFLVTANDEPLRPMNERVIDILYLNGVKVVHFNGVVPNPNDKMIEEAFELLKSNPCDSIVALGGGSAIDTAKVLALTYGSEFIDWEYLLENYDSPFVDYQDHTSSVLPLITVPTTSGTGSQVTQAAVISRGLDKVTIYHPQLFAKECILDPGLVSSLPLKMSMATGFDAFTHAFESYLNIHYSEYSHFDSINALKMITNTLPELHEDITNIEYRSVMSLADTLAGKALANSGADLPHPLSEIIGGITHMTHGVALACVFVPFIEVMANKHQIAFNELAHILNPDLSMEADGSKLLADIVKDFMDSIGMNVNLKSMGVTKEEFKLICESEVLHHLPFATYDECIMVLTKAYE